MLQLLSYLVFIISVAFAAGGIVLASRLRSRYRLEAFSALLYFQAFVYAFGFYGIWGQVLIRSFLAPYISEGLPEKITAFSVVMGLPFLVFAWLMLVQFSVLITGRKKSNWFILTFLVFNFAVIFVVGYIVTRSGKTDTLSLVRYYFIMMNSLYLIIAAGLTARPLKVKNMIKDRDIKIIAPLLILIMITQSVPLIFYSSQLWLALIFIFLFHAGYAFLPLWFSYGTILPEHSAEPASDLSFEGFCSKFEISPRETDIIREICNGLSNREISEKLFISLQTVKDHTHRIYIKTNVRSRVQLINLVRELRES
ncbi:MAG TPA: LuxR C-terminal-related transcriptional regulator [Bacteroidales bacterium]|nr:LuxR C-terminal-related transcriptional regulator [Bacteroidales bacterium]